MCKTLAWLLSTKTEQEHPHRVKQRACLGMSRGDLGQVRDPRVSSCQGSRMVQADATTQMAHLGKRPKKLQAWAGYEGSLVVPGLGLALSHLPLAGDSPHRALQMVRGIPGSSLPAHALAGRRNWTRYVILSGERVVQREQVTCPRSHSRQVAEQTCLCHLSHLDTRVPCFPAGTGSGVKGYRWRGQSVPLSARGLWPGHLPRWASGSSPIHNGLHHPALTWVAG